MSINFALVIQYPLLVICGVVALVVIKASILYALAHLFRMKTPYNITFSFILCQAGEFAFVIMQTGSVQGVVTPNTASIVMAIVALSMMLTPFLMMINDRLTTLLCKTFKDENIEYDTIDNTDCPVIIAGYGRMGQIIGRLLYAQGLEPIILEQSPEQINLLRHFGNKVYFGDALRLDVLRSAGIEKAKIMIITLGNPESALTLTKMVKEHFPTIKIMVRGRNRRHAYELHKAGADIVRRELLDSSLWMGRRVLETLGMRKYEARRKMQIFKKHDQEVLEHSFEFFDNEKEMLSFSRQSSEELQQILSDDRRTQHQAHFADDWDNLPDVDDKTMAKADNESELSTAQVNQVLRSISNDNLGALTTHLPPEDDKK